MYFQCVFTSQYVWTKFWTLSRMLILVLARIFHLTNLTPPRHQYAPPASSREPACPRRVATHRLADRAQTTPKIPVSTPRSRLFPEARNHGQTTNASGAPRPTGSYPGMTRACSQSSQTPPTERMDFGENSQSPTLMSLGHTGTDPALLSRIRS